MTATAILMGYLGLAGIIMFVAVFRALEQGSDIRWIIGVWLAGLGSLLVLLHLETGGVS